MNISITIASDGSDQPLLDGCAAATGWTSTSEFSEADWLVQKITEWVNRQAATGTVIAATAAQRAALIAAIQTAQPTIATTLRASQAIATLAGTPADGLKTAALATK